MNQRSDGPGKAPTGSAGHGQPRSFLPVAVVVRGARGTQCLDSTPLSASLTTVQVLLVTVTCPTAVVHTPTTGTQITGLARFRVGIHGYPVFVLLPLIHCHRYPTIWPPTDPQEPTGMSPSRRGVVCPLLVRVRPSGHNKSHIDNP